MNTFYLGIVLFLIVLAIFDLVVGVSNDAVNFLNSAIGAKVARFRTVLLTAAIGVFVGAAMSNGMMDVARHGIMMPEYYSFYDVMCVLLAVMVTDVILLDIFNTLKMPTSTTVSMVFELLGGAFAIALIAIKNGATDAGGALLSLGDLLNTEKALSVIFGIFLSVPIAFTFGLLVQWIARLVFSFTYRVNGTTTDVTGDMGSLTGSSLKIGIFAGIAVTSIIWFLLINGLKSSSFMTQDTKDLIYVGRWWIWGGGIVVFSLVSTILSAFKIPVLKFVVLLGTFSLAMAFAGNDLVNFVGVPLTGLDAYRDFMTNGNGDASSYLMTSLMGSAQTPTLFLILAGLIMVLALFFSKKAQSVVKTSVDLSRQDDGDEMFGSSAVARVLVRNTQKVATAVSNIIPRPVSRWIDSRFNADAAVLPEGAAFDNIRAAVNLVLAGLLVAFGTSMKLPLSTTYVTFMVAMGSSLADRAWSRECAVFRITGVLSVIGGWFITAGAAFIMCYLITNLLHFGAFVAMALAILVTVLLLIRSNMKFKDKESSNKSDQMFNQLCRTQDKTESWELLRQLCKNSWVEELSFASKCFLKVTDAFLHEEYRPLLQSTNELETARQQLKRARRREIIGLRRIDPIVAVEKNTWYFLSNSSMEQIIYCLKRINDPCREHVSNYFSPVPERLTFNFLDIQKRIVNLLQQTEKGLVSENYTSSLAFVREQAESLEKELASFHKQIIDYMQQQTVKIESATVFLNVVQESQEILGCLRQMIRGVENFLG